MNQDLDVLLKWATEKATKDPDESARPLWRQIAGEISNHFQQGLDSAPESKEETLWET